MYISSMSWYCDRLYRHLFCTAHVECCVGSGCHFVRVCMWRARSHLGDTDVPRAVPPSIPQHVIIAFTLCFKRFILVGALPITVRVFPSSARDHCVYPLFYKVYIVRKPHNNRTRFPTPQHGIIAFTLCFIRFILVAVLPITVRVFHCFRELQEEVHALPGKIA